MTNPFKPCICLVATALSCVAAGATCYGTRSFQTCGDDPGRSGDVRRQGDALPSAGVAPPSGDSRARSAPMPGDAGARQGAGASGRGAAGGVGASQNYGDTTYRQGIDQRGRYYNRTCTATGCF